MVAPYRHILAVIDFSDVSEKVIEVARKISLADGAKLSVLTVVEEIPVYQEMFGEFSVPAIDAEYWQELQHATKSELEHLVENIIGSGQAELELVTGNPKIEISRYALEHEADLIVMGSHGHRGVLATIGSTTDGVIHRAHCDVFTVRATPKKSGGGS